MGRRGVFVLATDGVPSPNCTGNTIAGGGGGLEAARASGAAIPTYVVGIATANDAAERAALQMIADGRRHRAAVHHRAIDDLAQKLLETLNAIRGQSLPCEFTIPPPRAGGTIDFGKVNVQLQGPGGDEETSSTSGSRPAATPCAAAGTTTSTRPPAAPPASSPARPPALASRPTPTATVEIRFGCATRTID